MIARQFAAHFIEDRVLYAKHVSVDLAAPSGVSLAAERWLAPAAAESRYRGKVAVLIGPANMSSAEAFLLMMKQSPKVALVGQILATG